MKREIFTFTDHSFSHQRFLMFLEEAANRKGEFPEKEIFLSFTDNIRKSTSFFKKIIIYSFNNKLGLMLDGEIFLPAGGDELISIDVLTKLIEMAQ